jgi:hypothetical protein
MAGWLQDLWGKASELWGKASEQIEGAQEEQEDQDPQETETERQREAEMSLRQVETRQRREAQQRQRRTNVRRKQMPPAEFQAWQARERELQIGDESFEGFEHGPVEPSEPAWPEDFEGLGGEVPGEQWREEAADDSLREVSRRQGQPEPGRPARQPEGEQPGARGERINEQILEALEAIREILEESKEILQEIKEKEPAGATYGA